MSRQPQKRQAYDVAIDPAKLALLFGAKPQASVIQQQTTIAAMEKPPLSKANSTMTPKALKKPPSRTTTATSTSKSPVQTPSSRPIHPAPSASSTTTSVRATTKAPGNKTSMIKPATVVTSSMKTSTKSIKVSDTWSSTATVSTVVPVHAEQKEEQEEVIRKVVPTPSSERSFDTVASIYTSLTQLYSECIDSKLPGSALLEPLSTAHTQNFLIAIAETIYDIHNLVSAEPTSVQIDSTHAKRTVELYLSTVSDSETKEEASHRPHKYNQWSPLFGLVSKKEPVALRHLLVSHLTPWIHELEVSVGDLWIMRHIPILVAERKALTDIDARTDDWTNQRARMLDTFAHHPTFPIPTSRIHMWMEYCDVRHRPMQLNHRSLQTILFDALVAYDMPVVSSSCMLHTIYNFLSSFRVALTCIVGYTESGVPTFCGYRTEHERALLLSARSTKSFASATKDDCNDDSGGGGGPSGGGPSGGGGGPSGSLRHYETSKRLMAAQLLQFRGVSEEMALAIADEWSTPSRFIDDLCSERKKRSKATSTKIDDDAAVRRLANMTYRPRIVTVRRELARGKRKLSAIAGSVRSYETDPETAVPLIPLEPANKTRRIGPTVAQRIVSFYLPITKTIDATKTSVASDDGDEEKEVEEIE